MLTTTNLALAALLASLSNAHMYMKTPEPFTFPDPSNKLSPLHADGSDFPCKMGTTGQYTPQGGATKMAIGEKQTLSFVGTAVHGGGSCQLALTKDKAPTPSTEWMVIHSIEGGCPARNTEGNLPEGGADSQDTYEFSIPNGVEPGEYVFAWTWFNRVGNREMYMNCAPIEVTGGAAKNKRDTFNRRQALSPRQDKFPSLFKANIGAQGGQCTTPESVNIAFPEPGDSVEIPGGPDSLQKFDCAGGSGGGAASGGSGSGSGGSGSGSGAAPSSPAPSPSGPSFKETSVPAPDTGAGSGSGQDAPAAPAPSTPAAAPTPAAPAAPAGGAASGGQSGACQTEGTFNCIDGASFQQCASGAWSVAQPMAAGTKCTPGEGSSLQMFRA